jgi:hypothetical protein
VSDAPFPHCDDLVLHAPGECEFCDHYPEAQADRERRLINFTGHHEPHKETCPAEVRRPIETIERWGGNVAGEGGTLKPHSEPPETLAWWLYGTSAEPAHDRRDSLHFTATPAETAKLSGEIRIPLDPIVASVVPKNAGLWNATIDDHRHELVIRF